MKPFLAVFRPIVRCFLTGVFAVLPLVITVAVVIWVAGFVGRLIGPDTLLGGLLSELGFQIASTNKTAAYTIGWLAVLGVIFLLGVAVEAGARKFVQGRIDSLAQRVPLLGGVYGTVKQLVAMVDKKHGADLKAMSVVFCIFGQENGAAFLALLPTPERFCINGVDYNAVLVPTAPMPVGGSLIFVPAASVHRSDLSVDAFMSIYVSMGVTGPKFLSESERPTPDA